MLPHSSIQKLLINEDLSLVTKIGWGVGAFEKFLENNMLILLISNKSRISVIMTLFMTSQCKNRLENDAITPIIKSAGIHLLY